ncbi:MAG: hypothetical protein UV57_C0033G0003 [Parcubacteria group bacterium GW2011_GWD2_43_10]|nr:MAG: hypothetical protein UV57_C0033G0003 [Parcubacteria group bacterium GW2011_GWD2_43_10]KKT22988.1 MAG: hypothetical protein UW06_C0003G0019 [Parcubacteria group bacterium GW2011_GWE1_43_8]KKT26428.1 MAG: hypothetical protein UW12_C0032G0003 [Parcubacteria group bacterium GW2011_GWF1_43_9]
MADGILCKNCGHQETSHYDYSSVDYESKKPGYKISLINCPRYNPENTRLTNNPKKKAKKTQNKLK